MILLAIYFLFLFISFLLICYLVFKLPIKTPTSLIYLLTLLIFSPLVFGYLYYTYIVPLPEISVPDVKYLKIEIAETELSKAGLKSKIVEKAYETSVPEGSVVSQKPDAGKKVKVGRIINLKVSIGKRKVAVPNLVGRPITQIEVVLEESGLRIGNKIEEDSEQYQTGVVCRQYPTPNEEVDLGSFVDVYVARNSHFGVLEMPNLVGKSVTEAKEILRKMKVNPQIIYHETREFPRGTVLSHEPNQYDSIDMGGTVKLFIATSPTKEAGQ